MPRILSRGILSRNKGAAIGGFEIKKIYQFFLLLENSPDKYLIFLVWKHSLTAPPACLYHHNNIIYYQYIQKSMCIFFYFGYCYLFKAGAGRQYNYFIEAHVTLGIFFPLVIIIRRDLLKAVEFTDSIPTNLNFKRPMGKSSEHFFYRFV